jgi:adenosylhomocysteine nucleosidase
LPDLPTPTVVNIAGRRIAFAMAAQAEYGEHLQQRFAPLITGVGPVEAAVAVSAMLAEARLQSRLPDLVVSLGSAGSQRLEQAQVYQAGAVSYRDMDASPLGFAKGCTPFLDLPATIEMPLRIPGIPVASLSTGADIVSGKAYDTIDADMVDMETFAVQRACMVHGVPLIALRGISDGAQELQHFQDWTEYLHVIDERLAGAVDTLFAAIASGALLREAGKS